MEDWLDDQGGHMQRRDTCSNPWTGTAKEPGMPQIYHGKVGAAMRQHKAQGCIASASGAGSYHYHRNSLCGGTD